MRLLKLALIVRMFRTARWIGTKAEKMLADVEAGR
jgi:hypothetical protein